MYTVPGTSTGTGDSSQIDPTILTYVLVIVGGIAALSLAATAIVLIVYFVVNGLPKLPHLLKSQTADKRIAQL